MKSLVWGESTCWVNYRSSPQILPLLNPGPLLDIEEDIKVQSQGSRYQWSRSSWGPFGDGEAVKASGKEEELGPVGDVLESRNARFSLCPEEAARAQRPRPGLAPPPARSVGPRCPLPLRPAGLSAPGGARRGAGSADRLRSVRSARIAPLARELAEGGMPGCSRCPSFSLFPIFPG